MNTPAEPIAYAIYRADGSLCLPIEVTRASAEHEAARLSALMGEPYTVVPLFRLDEPFASSPRTYQSAWQWNADDTAKLMSAEEWLEEEADVDASLSERHEADQTVEREDDGPDRGGILKAIAAEIRQIRAERTQWADAYTKLVSASSSSGTTEPTTLSETDVVCYMEPENRGGQHVGTRSDVTVRHVPTGICVREDGERTQFKNKKAAFKRLEALVALAASRPSTEQQ